MPFVDNLGVFYRNGIWGLELVVLCCRFVEIIISMDYSVYPLNWLSEIRPAILRRDGYKCTRCGAVRGQYKIGMETGKTYKVVLHIAHLDHDKENKKVKYSRLATMCQCCHMVYDNLTDASGKRGKRTNKPKLNCEPSFRRGRKERQYYFFGETKASPRKCID